MSPRQRVKTGVAVTLWRGWKQTSWQQIQHSQFGYQKPNIYSAKPGANRSAQPMIGKQQFHIGYVWVGLIIITMSRLSLSRW